MFKFLPRKLAAALFQFSLLLDVLENPTKYPQAMDRAYFRRET